MSKRSSPEELFGRPLSYSKNHVGRLTDQAIGDPIVIHALAQELYTPSIREELDLKEDRKNSIKANLKMINVTVDEFKANTSEEFDNLRGGIELKLSGSNKEKLDAILLMLNSKEVPSKWRLKIGSI